MDEAVSARLLTGPRSLATPAKRRLGALAWAPACALAACALALAPARAQTLDDPTRPPAALLAPAADAGAPAVASKPVLQSVLLGRGQDGRRVAVIDGQIVRVGGAVGGYVLASVGATEAVLVRGKEREVLKLYPSSAEPAAAVPQR